MESVGGAMLDDACHWMEAENLDQLIGRWRFGSLNVVVATNYIYNCHKCNSKIILFMLFYLLIS